MGYKAPSPTYKLVFEGRDGLEVFVRSVSIAQLRDIRNSADGLKGGELSGFDDAIGLFQLFARKLKSWNLEDENDSPMPATLETILELDFGFASEILLAWVDAMVKVPDPLAGRSTSGNEPQPLAASIPMEPLPSSLPPSMMPNSSSDFANGSTVFPVS